MAELPTRTRKTIPPETVEKVLAAYRAGQKVEKISRAYGVSQAYISSLANVHGIRRYGKNRR